MQIHPLCASPIARLRAKYGLSHHEAAARLGLSVGLLKLAERQSRKVPAVTLAAIEFAFDPASAKQMSFLKMLRGEDA